MTFFFFHKIREQEGRTGPLWRLLPVRGGRMWAKGVGEWIWCKYCVHLYANGKIRPVETITGIRGGRIKENDGGGWFKYDIFGILKELLWMPQCTCNTTIKNKIKLLSSAGVCWKVQVEGHLLFLWFEQSGSTVCQHLPWFSYLYSPVADITIAGHNTSFFVEVEMRSQKLIIWRSKMVTGTQT
jgi:hypothetical protein